MLHKGRPAGKGEGGLAKADACIKVGKHAKIADIGGILLLLSGTPVLLCSMISWAISSRHIKAKWGRGRGGPPMKGPQWERGFRLRPVRKKTLLSMWTVEDKATYRGRVHQGAGTVTYHSLIPRCDISDRFINTS